MGLFNRGKTSEDYELEPKGGKVKELIEQAPTSKLDTDRIDPVLLENMAYSEPVLLGGTIMWQTLIEDADFEVIVQDEKTQQEIDEVLDETTLREEMLEKFPVHEVIFGNFWLEHIFGKKKFITDFLAVDPKKMKGFKKKYDYSDIVLTNRLGRPMAYEMRVSDDKKVYYVPDIEMSHRPYLQVTHTQLGLGMVEGVYTDSTLKENLEQARVQNVYDLAWKKPVIGYGSEVFKSNADMEKRAQKLAQQMADPDLDWVIYPRAEFKLHEEEKTVLTDEIVNQLIYTTKLQAAVLGIPVAFLLQSGEGENRATLEQLADMFELRFRGFQRKMKVEKIIKNVVEWNNSKRSKSDQVKLDWKGLKTVYGILSDKAAKEFVMRVMRLGKTELIDKDDPQVRRKIDQALGIKRTSGYPKKPDIEHGDD